MSNQPRPLVLIVDDNEKNIQVLGNVIRSSNYRIAIANTGQQALDYVKNTLPDLILLDIMMPGMDGYEVCRVLKNDPETCNIAIIFLTAMAEEQDEAKGLALGAVDYVTKPFSPELVKARVNNQLEIKRYQNHLEKLVEERTQELALTQEVTIYSLASLAETRDPETGRHILRTQRYISALARELKDLTKFSKDLDEVTIDLLYKSAPLHDIGKVGVKDRILLKPGKLTEQEFTEMKNHTGYGREALRVAKEILGDNSFMHYAREIAYTHHEKWDGSGYPEGLSGDNIPISGRLMAIADVYDALISKRVYKPPFSHQKAVSMICEGKGSHFDPDMVDAFLAIEEDFRQIAIEFSDSDEEKEMLQQKLSPMSG